MEVVRDKNDNCIIVCAIENVDPMGVHTGDSITVAPAQTLTDKEYQIMRNASLAVLREIGVETGGSNVQFGINPDTGRMVVIEMNPRVSRSSALASKATGFPIAKIAAKLAVGYTLDELQNDITGGKTPASFEPSIDYVVTKIPRFNFEKFPQAENILSTQMKSVGEVMAIGRNFQESMQKALRGLEIGATGFDEQIDFKGLEDGKISPDTVKSDIKNRLTVPTPERIFYVADAFRFGMSVDEVFNLTKIDRWFLVQIADIVASESQIKSLGFGGLTADNLRRFKRKGFSDLRLANLLGVSQKQLRKKRWDMGVYPVYKRVDIACLNLLHLLLICIPAMMRKAKPTRPTIKKSWSSAAVQTVSDKALSLIIAASMPPLPCEPTAMKPSWLIVIPKPSLLTMTPRIVCILSRSHLRTC